MPTDPCEVEMQAYAEASGIYVDAMVESAIQYAESLQATADCDTAWQNWLQTDWNLSYCRDINGYGSRQSATEEPARVKTARQISRIRQAARKAGGVEFIERITDALGETDGKFTESQKLRLVDAREVLMKAMR